jgi:hypothetical protein
LKEIIHEAASLRHCPPEPLPLLSVEIQQEELGQEEQEPRQDRRPHEGEAGYLSGDAGMTDLMAKLEFKTQAEMLDEIIVLRKALGLIARKKKMDAVAAVSMRAIAQAAVTSGVREGKS